MQLSLVLIHLWIQPKHCTKLQDPSLFQAPPPQLLTQHSSCEGELLGQEIYYCIWTLLDSNLPCQPTLSVKVSWLILVSATFLCLWQVYSSACTNAGQVIYPRYFSSPVQGLFYLHLPLDAGTASATLW